MKRTFAICATFNGEKCVFQIYSLCSLYLLFHLPLISLKYEIDLLGLNFTENNN